MRPISKNVRATLEKQPRMRRCTLANAQDVFGECKGRLMNPEWHHVWTYAGRQIDEPWAIVAACTQHHEMVKSQASVRMAFEAASLSLATPEDLAKYPRKNWRQIALSLGMGKQYGKVRQ